MAGEAVTFDTEQFGLRDSRVRNNGRSGLPICVACSGPKMMELAGECADGVIMLSGATPETIEFGLSHLREGLARSGRKQEDIDVAWGAATVIDDERKIALDQTRLMPAWYTNQSA